VLRGYEAVRTAAPGLTASDVDAFLERVGRVAGRELPADARPLSWQPDPDRVRQALREVRTRQPLRRRLREAVASPVPEQALPHLDDAFSPALDPDDRARMWGEVAAALRDRFRAHPLELPDLVAAVAAGVATPSAPEFTGFCTDTFHFLGELAEANTKEWMAAERDRYQFVLREPLVELCGAVADRYVRPVLNRDHGWDLECDAKSGKALTSICKNDFGRTGPYQPVQWVTFYRRAKASKRADAQFFVRVAADGVSYGFHLGATAREAGRQFRRNVQEHAEAVFRALAASSPDDFRFWASDDLACEVAVKSAADLRQWATNKDLAVGKRLPPESPLLRRDELAGEVLLAFDRLLPLFASAADPDPRPLLARRAGCSDARGTDVPPLDAEWFARETFLSGPWLDRVLGLLRLKKQLILQGVPGTGKTHVARSLARLLAQGRPEGVRLVQFHPSYTYEEFVEGIRAKAGEGGVAYPVENGVLSEFAEQAAARPSECHVLVIDEINRGNLPRIFGELLYLLEYRDQAATLPYSKRPFRLPDNLLIVATMNAADRSAVALDQALRRRFSFVDMPPDAGLLASWLEANPPADRDGTFGPGVVRAFEELNRRLARDLGPDKQVGHSFFMVPGLDSEKLAAVWDHHVRPLLADYFGGREERLKDYTLDALTGSRPRKRPAGAK
jgi:uncharacterized protein (DUF2461 family)